MAAVRRPIQSGASPAIRPGSTARPDRVGTSGPPPTSAPRQPYGTGWDLPTTGKLRVLADVTYRSSYWTRSSPDGRFISHGVQNVAGSYVIDLQRGGMLVPINSTYDPNWFPDNGGFVFQGGP